MSEKHSLVSYLEKAETDSSKDYHLAMTSEAVYTSFFKDEKNRKLWQARLETISINFAVDDTESYYDEAREKAVLDAMDKAEQIAAVAHFTLGNPIYVSETGGPFPPVVYPVRDFGYTDGAEATTPISVGELEINVIVQMAFTIQ